MSLKPLLSTVTGRLTEEARRHVREEGARYQRWLKAAMRDDGVVPCPACHARLDEPSWRCPECAPYRRR